MAAEVPTTPTRRRARPGARRGALGAAAVMGAGTLLVGAAAFEPGVGAQGTPSATVTVSQGIDATSTVDVVLDGRICALRGVAYATVNRLAVPAGAHTLTILPSDGSCTAPVQLAEAELEAPAGTDLAVSTRPDVDGGAVSVQETDLSDLSTFKARVRLLNQTTGAVSATVTRLANDDTPLVVTDLAAGGATAATALTRGAHRVQVTTVWGTLSTELPLEGRRVVDLYVTGTGPDDGQLVVDTQLAANAEL